MCIIDIVYFILVNIDFFLSKMLNRLLVVMVFGIFSLEYMMGCMGLFLLYIELINELWSVLGDVVNS